MRAQPLGLALAALLLVPSLAGCVAQTEWAREATGLSTLAGRGLTGAGVRLAIIDTGIDPDHPAFAGRTVRWADLVNGQGKPYDDNGHGTHVAGLVVGATGLWAEILSGVKLAPSAPGVELLVIKAIRAGGEGSDTTVARAVTTAKTQGAHVILMSLGGAKGLLLGTETENAVSDALRAGVFVVAAAGNREGGGNGDVASPASVKDVIAVGAVDRNLRIASFSQRGDNGGVVGGLVGARQNPDRKPEIVAPGVGILGPWRGGQYATADGTSQAAPYVAAALALLLEAKPEFKREGSRAGHIGAVKSALAASAQKIGPLAGASGLAHDDRYGYGLLRADRWLDSLR
ncbi:MAG TPA: S8 family serine peptidase [Candidatus Thermoplasmatota archaeon]|nr:S8 family serine peptidase [Candidatus Thermoplasmatota archaeon]